MWSCRQNVISGVTIIFGPPANIRYGLTKNIIRVTSDPLYRFGPLGPRLGPGIAGSADG